MDERLIGILIENIQFQLRHEAYDRTLDVRDFAHSMTTGDGQEEEVTRYRRFEDYALKAQRVRQKGIGESGKSAKLLAPPATSENVSASAAMEGEVTPPLGEALKN